MTDQDFRPRLSVEVTEEQQRKLRECVPWGLQRTLFSTIIDDIIEMVEKHGPMVLAAIIDRKIKADQYLKIGKEATSGQERNRSSGEDNKVLPRDDAD